MNEIYEQINLDRNTPVPLYYQLEQALITSIKNGSLKNGEMVPPEKEFAKVLNISRTTVRQAFSELASQGYLDRLKAKGTFISTPKIYGEFIQTLEPFASEMKREGVTPTTNLLKASIETALPEIQKRLQLPDNSKVVVLERLRSGDDRPIVYVKTYLSDKLMHGVINEDLDHNSLYVLMTEKYNISVQSVNRQLTAISADDFTSKQLHVETGAPILFSETTGFDNHNKPVELSLASYRSDVYALNVNLQVKAAN
ncbi:MAG TPA: GntR family transcriptional regulator [Lactobacillus sp.]|nr:GntR family transcriptional regulator [Lactobacillus sp.]